MGCRPTIPEHMPEDFQKLMVQCWDTDAEKRPTFEEILKRLQVGVCHTPLAPPEDVSNCIMQPLATVMPVAEPSNALYALSVGSRGLLMSVNAIQMSCETLQLTLWPTTRSSSLDRPLFVGPI